MNWEDSSEHGCYEDLEKKKKNLKEPVWLNPLNSNYCGGLNLFSFKDDLSRPVVSRMKHKTKGLHLPQLLLSGVMA